MFIVLGDIFSKSVIWEYLTCIDAVDRLGRFFTGEELIEMIDMLKSVSKNPEIARKIKEYGPGYDVIYMDAYAEAYDGVKLDIGRKCLVEGVDVEIVSECIGISMDELEKIKEEL